MGCLYGVHFKTADGAEQELELNQHYLGPAGTLQNNWGLVQGF